MRLIPTLLTVLAVLTTGHTAFADSITHVFGDMTLKLDSSQWRVTANGPDLWVVEPINQNHSPPKVIRTIKLAASTKCGDLAKAELTAQHYRELDETTMTVGGSLATKIVARSGCRSLSPRGQSLCIPYRDLAYLITQDFNKCGFSSFAFKDVELFNAFVSEIKLAKPRKNKP